MISSSVLNQQAEIFVLVSRPLAAWWERTPTASQSQPASLADGGRNAALYQQLSFLPVQEQKHSRGHTRGGNHKHARARLWLGSPPCVFLFRQEGRCETEEAQWSDCAPSCVVGSAVWRPTVDDLFWWWQCWWCWWIGFRGGGEGVGLRYIHMEKDGNDGSEWVHE